MLLASPVPCPLSTCDCTGRCLAVSESRWRTSRLVYTWLFHMFMRRYVFTQAVAHCTPPLLLPPLASVSGRWNHTVRCRRLVVPTASRMRRDRYQWAWPVFPVLTSRQCWGGGTCHFYTCAHSGWCGYCSKGECDTVLEEILQISTPSWTICGFLVCVPSWAAVVGAGIYLPQTLCQQGCCSASANEASGLEIRGPAGGVDVARV